MVDIVQNFRWELNLYLIASIKNIYAKKKCSIQSNILNYIKINFCSLSVNFRNNLATKTCQHIQIEQSKI